MTALLASFWPYIVGALGVAAAFVTRWWTKRQGVQAVEQAKTETETAVRSDVAKESQAVTDRAVADAIRIRQQADARAASIAAQGDDALNAELERKGGLRD